MKSWEFLSINKQRFLVISFISPRWLLEFIHFMSKIPGRSRWPYSMQPPLWVLLLQGDMLSLFLWWEGLAITSVFQIWGRKDQNSRRFRVPLSFLSCFLWSTPLIWVLLRYHGEGLSALSLDSLTGALEGGDTGSMLILLAIGIKAAFLVCMFG